MTVKVESISQFDNWIVSLGVDLQTCETFDDQIILGEGTSLIKTANVNFPCEWDSEGLRAEDGFLD